MLTELHCPVKWQESKIRRDNRRVTLNETRVLKKKKSVDESSAGPSRGLSQSSPRRILDVSWEEAAAAGIGGGQRKGHVLTGQHTQ